jgi:hypothetical protein
MYDLLEASEGLIGHGTGIVNVNGIVLFSLGILFLTVHAKVKLLALKLSFA